MMPVSKEILIEIKQNINEKHMLIIAEGAVSTPFLYDICHVVH